MNYRHIKQLNFDISEISLGTWGLDSSFWGDYDVREIYKAYFTAKELGINSIDTAAAYGNRDAEKLLGNIIKEFNWEDVFIGTKIQPLVSAITPLHPDQAFPRQYIIKSTEESLKCLGIESLPLQQLHTWDDTWLGSGEWLETMYDLKREGKIRSIGVSIRDHAADSAIGIIESGYIDFVQLIYNIFDQSASDKLFKLCLDKNVNVIVRSPLYEGVFSGKLNRNQVFPDSDWRNGFFSGGHLEECLDRVDEIYKNVSFINKDNIAEYAIKFSLSHPAVKTVAVGMRNSNHVWENSKASSDFLLSDYEISKLKPYSWLFT